MFVVNAKQEGASSKFRAIKTIHTRDENELLMVLKEFIRIVQILQGMIQSLINGREKSI